mmetsp:Transcript_95590/g.247159  ORF Transcript_95590/g.247159 Transcript_95590/m.247159 type:complete len:221 (-) Transcript_95590:328-990(-)
MRPTPYAEASPQTGGPTRLPEARSLRRRLTSGPTRRRSRPRSASRRRRSARGPSSHRRAQGRRKCHRFPCGSHARGSPCRCSRVGRPTLVRGRGARPRWATARPARMRLRARCLASRTAMQLNRAAHHCPRIMLGPRQAASLASTAGATPHWRGDRHAAMEAQAPSGMDRRSRSARRTTTSAVAARRSLVAGCTSRGPRTMTLAKDTLRRTTHLGRPQRA